MRTSRSRGGGWAPGPSHRTGHDTLPIECRRGQYLRRSTWRAVEACRQAATLSSCARVCTKLQFRVGAGPQPVLGCMSRHVQGPGHSRHVWGYSSTSACEGWSKPLRRVMRAWWDARRLGGPPPPPRRAHKARARRHIPHRRPPPPPAVEERPCRRSADARDSRFRAPVGGAGVGRHDEGDRDRATGAPRRAGDGVRGRRP